MPNVKFDRLRPRSVLVPRVRAASAIGVACAIVAGSTLVGAVSSTPAGAAKATGGAAITTIAGGGSEAPTSGVVSTAASLGSPLDAVFDAHGNVVFADQNNNVISVVAASTGKFYGTSMLAGHTYNVAGDGNPAGGDGPWGTSDAPTTVEFNDPNGVAVDSEGDIAFTDSGNNAVRVLAGSTATRFGVPLVAGKMFTLAGEGGSVSNGEQASSAGLQAPDGIAFDAHGNLIIADTGNDDLRYLPAQTGVYFGQEMTAGDIYIIAGNGNDGYSGDGGPAVDAQLAMDSFNGVAVDPRGDVIFSDVDNNVVRLVAASSGTYLGRSLIAGDIYTVAGNGNPNGGFKGDKKPAVEAELNSPQGVAVDAAGNLYISDSVNNRVRFVAAAKGKYDGATVKTGDIYTIAGTGAAAYSGNGGPATAAALNGPAGLSVGPSGQILVADNGNDVIREIGGGIGGTAPAGSEVPSATGIKPASGPTVGGKKVTIVGTGLSGVTAVLFGSREGTSVEAKSDKKVVVDSPASAAGAVVVRIVSSAGESVAGSYTYVAKAAKKHRHRH